MAFKVYTYTKFGDHCVAYSIVKEFAKRHGKVECYCDEVNTYTFNTNKRLFSSLKDVELIRETYVPGTHNFAIANIRAWLDQVQPWYDNPSLPLPDNFDETWFFDRQWYLNASVPFNYKWDNFYFERNLQKEKEVYYDILKLRDNEEFIFLLEDPSRNLLNSMSL